MKLMPRFLAQSARRMGLSSAEMGRLWEEQDWIGGIEGLALNVLAQSPPDAS